MELQRRRKGRSPVRGETVGMVVSGGEENNSESEIGSAWPPPPPHI